MKMIEPDTTTHDSNVVKKGENDEDRTADDLISRQAAIDVLEERLQASNYSNVALVSELNRSIGYLMRLPSAQPDIIRCKDCLMHGVCRFEQGLGLDGYCSQAKRRTDG